MADKQRAVQARDTPKGPSKPRKLKSLGRQRFLSLFGCSWAGHCIQFSASGEKAKTQHFIFRNSPYLACFFLFLKHGHLSSHCAYKLPLMSHSGTRFRVYIHNLGRMLSVTGKTEPRQSGSSTLWVNVGSAIPTRIWIFPQFCLYCPSVFFILRFVPPWFLQFSWWSQSQRFLIHTYTKKESVPSPPGHPLLSLPWFLWAAFCI